MESSHPLYVQVRWRRGPMAPAWAALCGALASGALTLATDPLLRLALLLFLVEGVWGGVWSALAGTDWATPLRQWREWREGTPVRWLPHASPEAPAGRLAVTLGHLRSWWAQVLRPTLGPTVAALALLLPLALVVGGVLGPRLLLLSLAAISLVQFVFAWRGGDAQPVPGFQAVYEVGLPWLAGHILFAELTWPSVLLALAFALAYAGYLRLTVGRAGLVPWNLGWAVAVGGLVAGRHPLAAGLVGGLLFGQAIAQPALFDAETGRAVPQGGARFARLVWPWWLVAMLVAAWGVGG